ncbi:MAG: PIG-L family deacetylase [Actinomycetota bacterium]
MSSPGLALMGGRVRVPLAWTSVLAVIAHPDEGSSGLGAILDAFVLAGARVEVLCLTHAQLWTLQAAPGDLAALRGAELPSAADVLGPTRAQMNDLPDGELVDRGQTNLAAEVFAAAASCLPDGLLVFDTAEVTGHLDHVAASTAALLAAETLALPVLGWALSDEVAARLRQEFGVPLIADQDMQIDLWVSLERARQRLASHALQGAGPPGSVRWSRLQLLASTRSLRWLRPPAPQHVQEGVPAPPADHP